MDCYQERKKIYTLLENNHLDTTRFVVGAGKTFSGKKSRFVFDATKQKGIIDQTAEYALKYYSAYDVYLVWKVKS